MNKTAILPDALNRFRHASSQYALTTKSRASRLLALKEDISALRKRGVPYRAVSELLTQCGITPSDTCVINFCHRIPKERRRQPSAARRAPPDANLNPTRKTAPNAAAKAPLSATPTTTGDALRVTNESAPVKFAGRTLPKLNCLHPENNMIKRLDLILNCKGGVGKIFFAVNFVEYLKDKNILHTACDCDNENCTLKRFHGEAVEFLDLSRSHALDAMFGAFEKTDLVVVDCRAASTEVFFDYFDHIDLRATRQTLSAASTLVIRHPASGRKQLEPSRKFQSGNCQAG
jgi:hypothetical protein